MRHFYLALAIASCSIPCFGETIEFREPATSVATPYPYLTLRAGKGTTLPNQLFYHLTTQNSCADQAARQPVKLNDQTVLGPLTEGSYLVCVYQENKQGKVLATYHFDVGHFDNPNF